MSKLITDELIKEYMTKHLSVKDFGHLIIPDDARLNNEALSVIKKSFKDFIKHAEHKYVIIDDGHFTYDHGKVWCTHGSWGGELVINEDGSCKIIGEHIRLECKSYIFTEAASYEQANVLGLLMH